ncbi:MAG: formylmethanofuran dehydrogenase subunit E family protein, partial [Dehalococcoidia bacterium]|nr:formylmethanofuran dehydrogenase subunit E family protein [Dehalococcoidia bacterium]
MEEIGELLAQSMALHGGHPCAGQVLGVRMAMAGCRELGIEEPKKTKQLIVYVEIDRCATDAIQAVTNCKLGKRTLKHMDYGKMAATFVNLATGKAVRVVALESARDKAHHYCQSDAASHEAQIQAYQIMPEEEILTLTPVFVKIPPQDMPGPPSRHVTCEACGECVNDGRELLRDG